jgi:uncharacterized protein YjbI with pentapeptide repeats
MHQTEFLELLAQRPRKLRDIDASGVDLRGASLDQMDFTNINLSRAILTDGDLRSSTFRACNFDAAALDGTKLHKTQIYNSSMQEVNFRGANLRNSSFHAVSLKCADLRNTDLTRAGFSDIDLRHADLTGAIFYSTVMDGVRGRGVRGAWFRPNDNRIERLDMSEAGDGSDMRDASALIDHENGKPRPIRIRLTAFADVIREEPNAREDDIKYDELPVDDKLRGALRDWQNTLADAYDGAETADPAKLDVADRQGREVWRALSAVLKDHRIRYEPPHEDAAIEDAPEETARA